MIRYKKEEKHCKIGAHTGIDPRSLIPQSDTLTTRPGGQVIRAHNNCTCREDKLSAQKLCAWELAAYVFKGFRT